MKATEKKPQGKTEKKKYTRAEKQRVIAEISQSINRNITRRNLMRMLLHEEAE